MAACVLCRLVPRLRRHPGLRKDFTLAQLLHIKQVDETDDQKGNKEVPQHREDALQAQYRLFYNCVTSRSQAEKQEDGCLSALGPSIWQQGNHLSISCSRQFSSSTLLDLAFNKSSEPQTPSESTLHRKTKRPDVWVDTRAFLECRPDYASMTLDLTQRPHPVEWVEVLPLLQKVTVLKGHMKSSDASQLFVGLSHLHPDRMSLLQNDQRFVMLLQYSADHLHLFTTPQLMEVLQSLVWLDIPTGHSILGLVEAELCCRIHQMSLHQLLLAADLWRCIGGRVPQFLRHFYGSVRLHLRQMEVPELVHLLYIIGEGRKCPADVMRPVEQLLLLHLHKLYPEEVGTVCLGLFKSQTSISENTVTRIVEKALSFVEEMSDFAIVNVLKYLRFSYLYHREWMEAMAQEVPRRAHRMGVMGLMHVTLTCSALHYRNDKILMAIAERVPSLFLHCRSKDSSKLLWAFGNLGFQPAQSPNLYPSLTEALRRKKVEFQQYPEHLLTGLLGLIFCSHFPEDLITLALSPEFVTTALKSSQLDLRKDLFTLDGAVALELPHWTGPRLSRELREEVTEVLWNFAQSDLCQKPEVQEAESVLQDLLGGERFVRKRMILPHTRSIDLEVHLDASGKPLPVNLASAMDTNSEEIAPTKAPSQGLRRMNVGVAITDELFAQLTSSKNTAEPLSTPAAVKPPPLHRVDPEEGGSLFDTRFTLTSDLAEALIRPRRPDSASQDSVVRLAIQVSSRNHYCCHSRQLLGLHSMKRRQLKLAGYRVVELNHHEWFPMLRKSRTEKLAYMHCKVYNSL